MILPPQRRFKLQLILSSIATYQSHDNNLKTEAMVHPRKTNFLEISS